MNQTSDRYLPKMKSKRSGSISTIANDEHFDMMMKIQDLKVNSSLNETSHNFLFA